MIKGVVLALIGLLLFYIGSGTKKIAKKAVGMAKAPTGGSESEKALWNSGLFTEHGMAQPKEGGGPEAQSRRSDSFYDHLS